MKIGLKDIPHEGMHLELTEKEEAFRDISGEKGYGFTILSSVTSHLTIRKKGGEIVVEGSARARVGKVCSRCLKGFEEERDWKITSTLVIYGEGALKADKGLYPFLHGDELDTTGIIREQLALDLPMKSLCNEECKGLCVKCGADLNKSVCKCSKEKEIDPRFSLLSNLKIE